MVTVVLESGKQREAADAREGSQIADGNRFMGVLFDVVFDPLDKGGREGFALVLVEFCAVLISGAVLLCQSRAGHGVRRMLYWGAVRERAMVSFEATERGVCPGQCC